MEDESGVRDTDDVTDDNEICDTYASDPGAAILENAEDLEADEMSASASLYAQKENDEEAVSNNMLGSDEHTPNAENTTHDIVRDDNFEEDESHVRDDIFEKDESHVRDDIFEKDESHVRDNIFEEGESHVRDDNFEEDESPVRDDNFEEDESHVATSQQVSDVDAGVSRSLQDLNGENVVMNPATAKNTRIPKNVQDTLRMAEAWYGDLGHKEGHNLRKRPNPTPDPSGSAKKQRN